MSAPDPSPPKQLTPEAQRALAEAEARRLADAAPVQKEGQEQGQKRAEKGGPSGPEPTRYGDWERKGIAVDF